MELYHQILWGRHFAFKDSYNFLPASLDNLTKTLVESDFIEMTKRFGSDLPLVRRKGCFPYSWFDDESKLHYSSLPSKEDFFNELSNEAISDEEYNYALRIWNHFSMRTFEDYHDLYLTIDVLLLSDIIGTFRDTCMDTFMLDPAHYITLPSLAWDAMLRTTRVQLELFTDITKYIFCELGTRGGISSINHRYARANNEYVVGYDENQKTSHILYLDMNSLYPTAMKTYLPYKNFEWDEDTEKYTMNFIMNIADEGSRGCILEVDLDYPDHLHDLHNMYPLAAEHVTTSLQFLSPYNTGTVVNSKQRKLIPNLSRKEKYIVHFSALKFYLIQGLVLTRVRKVLVFDQAAWMGPFLDKCVYNRQRATSEFHKDFWKYMMNSCFGKTMENLRLRQRIDIINEKEKALRLIAKPTFKRAVIFDRRLAASERFKTRQILN